jgi:hypothetical protein
MPFATPNLKIISYQICHPISSGLRHLRYFINNCDGENDWCLEFHVKITSKEAKFEQKISFFVCSECSCELLL